LLFVAGDEPNSRLAKENFAQLRHSLPDHCCEIQIIDVLEDYEPALEHNVLVTPCLLLLEPAPAVHVVGTLSDIQRVRAALRLPSE
jgi:circadian clock protein KaiB